MASIYSKQPESLSLNKPHKVLTAGFNSPVPECTLQVSSHFTKTRRQELTAEPSLAPSAPLLQRSWVDRFLEIF